MADAKTFNATNLRVTAATLIILGIVTVVATLIFTNTSDALMTGCWLAVFLFGLPAAGAWAAAYWLEMRTRSNVGDMEEL